MPRYDALLVAIPSVLLTLRSSPAADVKVQGLEVTQGVQDLLNPVDLVAGRSTAVRVTLDTGGAPVGGITGRLHVVIDGTTEITPSAGCPAVNEPFSAPSSPRRENAGDTLNFVLPCPGARPLAPTSAKFKVEVSFPSAGTAAGRAYAETPDLKVVEPLRPILYQVRLRYWPMSQANATDAPATGVVDPAGAKMLLAICPLSDEEPSFCRLIPGNREMTFSFDVNTLSVIDGEDSDQLLTNLETVRQLIVKKGYGADDRVFLFGWLPGDPSEYYGYARCPGKVGYGNTLDDRFQRTFAHEFCHMLGLDHNSRTIDQVGWDVMSRLPGSAAKARTLHDIMMPGETTANAWIDLRSYQDLLGARLPGGPGSGGMTDRVLVVRGIMKRKADPTKDSKVAQVAELRPVFRYPWRSQAAPENSPGAFQVEVTGADEKVTRRRFDAWNASGEAPNKKEEKRLGAFSVMIPMGDAQARSVSITDPGGQTTFGRLEGSLAPPVLTINSPPDGAHLDGQVLMTWNVEDPDTKETEITYQVAFSPDQGQSFLPLSWDTKERRLSFSIKGLPNTAGSGVIRVFACDGLNTAWKDVVGLTIAGQ